MKTSFRPGLNFGENHGNGRISRLHYTWLVPCTRASSDDVDDLFTLRVDPLEEERSTWRAWPNQYLRRHRMMLCGGTAALGKARRGLKLRLVSGQSWTDRGTVSRGSLSMEFRTKFSAERYILLERTVEVQGDDKCFNHLRDQV
ncbi:hypothetical protein M9H77_27208 [Catharanthus roseus]|uniref:Uncharacterized protein n=1 Tax=Catharanthus roseus TaxID=4058 RepID=A0ACC0ADR2_CATRO|nr:hypothetical protein M9H77_27208 [Catharanthus roseus]